MIRADAILADFTQRLEEDSFFENIKITRAYPDEIKPTRLNKAVIAVGLKNIIVEDDSIGQNVKAGSYGIFAHIYVPYSHSKRLFENIVFRICRDIAELNIMGIEVSEITANTTAECFVMKSVFTFNDEISFKEE